MSIITGGVGTQIKTPSQEMKQGGATYTDSSLKDMIEVKTSSNNYKIGKTTINSRIGEDYEPDKPILNYNQHSNNNNQPDQK